MPLAPNGEAATSPMLPAGPGPEAPVPAKHGSPGRPRDPNTCFFEGQQRPHGARWAPNYDPLCSLCICQRRTVICDPVVCPPPSCPHPVQALDQCCPVCPEKQRSRDLPSLPNLEPGEGCYFDGDRSWRAAGTRWHPVVPPFGLIKCAVCTCKGQGLMPSWETPCRLMGLGGVALLGSGSQRIRAGTHQCPPLGR